MRKISIIGGGRASLFLGIGLVDAGYDVTLYSDRSADDCLNRVRPPGNAIIQQGTIALEREYGISFWEEMAPDVNGVEFNLAPEAKEMVFKLRGAFGGPAQRYDLRMKNSRWMREFETRGGRIEIARVDIPALEDIAASSEPTVVAAGKWSLLGRLFERGMMRSEFEKLRRYLYMLYADLPHLLQDQPPDALRVHPALRRILLYALSPQIRRVVHDGPVRGRGRRTHGHVPRHRGERPPRLRARQGLRQEIHPLGLSRVRRRRAHGRPRRLAGAFPPSVYKPVGRLPSGRIVTPLSGTAIAYDPVGSFGGNNGECMARLPSPH